MIKHVSIRSYTREAHGHAHSYHQLVLPLHGSIDIRVGEYAGFVSAGDCVIVRAEYHHEFKANEAARFIIVDLDTLPTNLDNAELAKFAISPALFAFLQFLEKQLAFEVSATLESHCFMLLEQLLSTQQCALKMDHRIERAIALIQQDLSQSHSLEKLAKNAYLSVTQFKKVFKQSTGTTTQKYLLTLRMEKAKALLSHTDLPVRLVALDVGYHDLSAFSRRFSAYFGQSPSAWMKRRVS